MSYRGPRWFRYLHLVRRDVARDVDEELAFHVEMRIQRNIELGMSPDEARRDAMRKFGDVAPVRELLMDHDRRIAGAESRREYRSDILQDIRFGLRALRRAPAFAVTAVLTLAVGIGANAAIFSALDAVALRSLPYTRPDELVSVGQGSGGEFLALRERLRSFAQLAAYAPQTHPVDDGQTSRLLEGTAITPNLLSMLGAKPLIGRGFTEADGRFGEHHSLLLSYGLWQRMFGGSADAVGKRVFVEGVSCIIIGVMPPDFQFPNGSSQYWQPYAFYPANVGYHWAVGGIDFIGRLAPGVSFAQAQQELHDVWPTLGRLNPLWRPGPEYGKDVRIAPLQANLVGSTPRLLWLLFGCVVVVLLVGCVNVANLLLARGTARERELAIRAALGGGRGRLVRQLITESVLLSGIGALLGIGFAWAALRWSLAAIPAGVPRAHEIALDGTALAFTAIVAGVTAVLFGVVPALRATGSMRPTSTRGGRASAGTAHHRLSGALVAAELALAVVLVIAAALLARSFAALSGVDAGFQTAHVIAARITPPEGSYDEPARTTAFYSSLLNSVAAAPGVRSVAAVDKLPLAQPVRGVAARIEGQFEDNTRPLPDIGHWQMVTPSYFATMGIPIQLGRDFTPDDREGQQPVAIVSESFAKRFWPAGGAIGRRIGYPYDSPWMTIVGVVPDVKQDSLRDTSTMSMYVPWQQRTRMSGSEMWLVARSEGDAADLGATIRNIVRDADRSVAVSDLRTMDAIVARSVHRARLTMLLVAAFALTALLLGAIGIYGVMSYLVGQRMHEMGIRLALGASRREVIRLVLEWAAGLASVGAVVGVAAALVSTRALSSMLVGISPTDPLTFVAVPLLFVVVAALAAYAPARRATRVDPVRTLRGD
jgi:predicted permease